MPKKKKVKSIKNKRKSKIDIDQILLSNRQLFLFGAINEENANNLIQRMVALSKVSDEPIVLYINSGGGSVSDGFAIIDCMRGLPVHVITFVVGSACSMAGVVAIAGAKRYMSTNSVMMFHDMAGGIWGDYTTKALARAKHLEQAQAHLFSFIRANTKLSEEEIHRAIVGELWLNAKDCRERGVVDTIAGVENDKK